MVTTTETTTVITHIKFELFDQTAKIMRAINNRFRKKIIAHLINKPGSCVTDIYLALRAEQSVVSTHLLLLKNAGFVTSERQGKFIHYSVNFDVIQQVSALCEKLIEESWQKAQ